MQMPYDIKSHLDLVRIILNQAVNRNVHFIECAGRPVEGAQSLMGVRRGLGDKSITVFFCNLCFEFIACFNRRRCY